MAKIYQFDRPAASPSREEAAGIRRVVLPGPRKWKWAGVHAVFFVYGPQSSGSKEWVIDLILSGAAHLDSEALHDIHFVRHGANTFKVKHLHFFGKADHAECMQCSLVVKPVDGLEAYQEERGDVNITLRVVSMRGLEQYL